MGACQSRTQVAEAVAAGLGQQALGLGGGTSQSTGRLAPPTGLLAPLLDHYSQLCCAQLAPVVKPVLPALSCLCRQDKETGAMVTFCTGVRADDTLMPMWCGTDYENENSRKCSSYFNMLYEVLLLLLSARCACC